MSRLNCRKAYTDKDNFKIKVAIRVRVVFIYIHTLNVYITTTVIKVKSFEYFFTDPAALAKSSSGIKLSSGLSCNSVSLTYNNKP